jgi:hypothetical protein
MAKKKTSEVIPLAGYIPANFSPGITGDQIKLIPPYADKGVRYEGYSKDQRGSDYTLIKQETRFYSQANTNIADGPVTLTRPNKSTAIFYCTGILVQYTVSATALTKYIDLQDGSAVSPRFRVFMFGDAAGVVSRSFYINFKDHPRMFDGDIIIQYNNGLSNLEFFHIELFGWDETR